MTPMLEKMARAAEAAAEYDGDDGMADSQGIARVANWPAVARAALLAIRDAKWPDTGRDHYSSLAWQGDVGREEMTAAMVDAILNEKPEA